MNEAQPKAAAQPRGLLAVLRRCESKRRWALSRRRTASTHSVRLVEGSSEGDRPARPVVRGAPSGEDGENARDCRPDVKDFGAPRAVTYIAETHEAETPTLRVGLTEYFFGLKGVTPGAAGLKRPLSPQALGKRTV